MKGKYINRCLCWNQPNTLGGRWSSRSLKIFHLNVSFVSILIHISFVPFRRVSLELLGDGSPKPPKESFHDGLPKLYIHRDAFLKVLGATVDVDMETITPILFDREGNRMDPNA